MYKREQTENKITTEKKTQHINKGKDNFFLLVSLFCMYAKYIVNLS